MATPVAKTLLITGTGLALSADSAIRRIGIGRIFADDRTGNARCENLTADRNEGFVKVVNCVELIRIRSRI